MKMPTLFLSHGSPTIMMEQDSPGRAFLSQLAQHIPRPREILVISAHWETDVALITATHKPKTIHDFYGFPQELYERTYPAPGAVAMADKITQLASVKKDLTRGLDHGVWSPLSLMYPAADIPVSQLSIQPGLSIEHHYEIGKSLSELRDDGVLIVGSGSVTHNLRELVRFTNDPAQWAIDFEDWFVKAIVNHNHHDLLNAPTSAPDFVRSHPSIEHWLPLYVAMGAARESSHMLYRGFEHKNLSMAAACFN